MKQIEKLEIALEQLEDALSAYFHARYYSAIVLAGASEQLLAGYVLKHGGTPAWSQSRSAIVMIANGLKLLQEGDPTPTTEQDIGDLLNHAYNNSKHAGSKDHTLQLDPKSEAHELIDRAVLNFDFLLSRPDYSLHDIPLIERFRMEGIGGVRRA